MIQEEAKPADTTEPQIANPAFKKLSLRHGGRRNTLSGSSSSSTDINYAEKSASYKVHKRSCIVLTFI